MPERSARLPSRTACSGIAILLLALNLFILADIPPTAATPLKTSDIQRLIDINQADGESLQILPGIGPKRAEAIISEREANGPFTSLKDLQRVRGIGPRTAERIAPFIRINSQPAPPE